MEYDTVATVAGAWACPLRLPAVPVEQVLAALAEVAAAGYPVAAMLHDDPVTEVVMYRDPSRRRGTPDVLELIDSARLLATRPGWTSAPELAPRAGVLVGLGLREGYEPGAPVHEPGEVAEALPGARCRVALLVSARLVDGRMRAAEEVGVAVEASRALLPRIEQVAAAMAQDRYVITDFDAGETVARKLRNA